MRGILLWFFGATLAFLLTAGAFLLLANLSNSFTTRGVAPKPAPSSSTPPLQLQLSEARLENLEARPGQTLPLKVENAGVSSLTNISLTMSVTSEDTSRPGSRYYRATIENLAPDDSKIVRFTVDLSRPDEPQGSNRNPSDSFEPRSVLEFQATTPEGISAVKSVVLPL